MATVPTKPRGGKGRRIVVTRKDRDLVRAMVVNGVPHADIAPVVGMHVTTLRDHFREELDHGKNVTNANVANRLYHMAMHGRGKESVTACIFILKTRAGWKETHVMANPDGSGLFDEVPDAKLAALTVAAAQALAKNGGQVLLAAQVKPASKNGGA